MLTPSPYTWVDATHQVAFHMNPTDNSKLNYICCTEAALGQATAQANIPLTGKESPTDLKTLLLRCRELLKRLDHLNVHHREQDELVAFSDLASEMSQVNELQNSLSTITRLANRLASLETPQAQSTYKPKKVKDPEPFTGSQTDLKYFKNQLAVVLADVGRFTDSQHQLHYSFSLLKRGCLHYYGALCQPIWSCLPGNRGLFE